MIKSLPNLIPLLFFTVMGFYSVSSNSNKNKDWVGTYESTVPNFIERKIILKENKIKRALFDISEKSKMISLNEDFTFKFFEVYGNKDTLFYNGTWEFTNEAPLLHFEKDNSSLEKLSFTGKVYYKDYLIPCKDTTKRDLRINVFKKVK